MSRLPKAWFWWRKGRPRGGQPAKWKTIVEDLLACGDSFVDVIRQGEQDAEPRLYPGMYDARLPYMEDVKDRTRVEPWENAYYVFPVPPNHHVKYCRCSECGAMLRIVPCIACEVRRTLSGVLPC